MGNSSQVRDKTQQQLITKYLQKDRVWKKVKPQNATEALLLPDKIQTNPLCLTFPTSN